jgi:5'-AMP-activated protein kinase, regulatory beta subunit
VEVQGSFDNWSSRQALQRSGKDYTIVKLLPPGVYQVSCLFVRFSWPTLQQNLGLLTPPCLQYKFIVDGNWTYDPNQPAMFDEMGNVNNVLEVQEYVPENLDSLSGFEPPPSPESRCASTHAFARCVIGRHVCLTLVPDLSLVAMPVSLLFLGM